MSMLPYIQKGLCICDEVKDLVMGDYSALFWWDQCNCNDPYKREAGGEIMGQWKQRLMMETKIKEK